MLKEIIISIESFFDAHRFIKHHRLWKWILIPGILYCVLFVIGMYFFWTSSNEAIEWMFLKSGIKKSLGRLEEGWFSFFFIVGQIIFRFILLLFYFSLFKFFFLIIGSPVFSYLSEKTESIIEDREFPFSFAQLLKDIARAIRMTLRNAFWQTIYVVALLILSFIPLAGWIAPLVVFFLDSFYMGFSMLDYSSERNHLTSAESIDFINQHRGLAIGNGIVFYSMHFVPIIGWLFAPSYAVVAATLSLHKARQHEIIIQ